MIGVIVALDKNYLIGKNNQKMYHYPYDRNGTFSKSF